MALKAVGLYELTVAECTRLTGCSPVGLGLLQPQAFFVVFFWFRLRLWHPHQAVAAQRACVYMQCLTPARVCLCHRLLGSCYCPQLNILKRWRTFDCWGTACKDVWTVSNVREQLFKQVCDLTNMLEMCQAFETIV